MIEERNENGGVIDAIADDHLVYSVGDPGKIVLWNENNTGTNSGPYGGGLDTRLWITSGPDGSTWATRVDDSNAVGNSVHFNYTTEGVSSTAVRTASGSSTWISQGENPLSKFRYLWKGGRSDGDGLLMMPNGTEHDTHRGSPMGEDAFAYPNYVAGTFFTNANNEWTHVQEREAFAGTQGTWSTPRTIDYDKYYPSAEWNADPYHVAKVSQWIGIVALTAASGGTAAPALLAWGAGGTAAGVVIGGTTSKMSGGTFWEGAETGGDIGNLVGGFGSAGIRMSGGAIAGAARFARRNPALTSAAVVGLTASEAEAGKLKALTEVAEVLLKVEKATPAAIDLTRATASRGRSYVTYVLRNARQEITYIGRASGKGLPTEVMLGRIGKGHGHITRAMIRSGELEPVVYSVHRSRSAMRGAEHYFYKKLLGDGVVLTNKINPIGFDRIDRATQGVRRLQSFLVE